MPNSSLFRMFHVKHSSPDVAEAAEAPDASSVSPRRMFHVKHRGSRVMATALLAVTLFATGCASIQSPEGWAAPVKVDEQVLVQSSKGQVSLVNPDTGAIAWTFPSDDDKGHVFYATPILDDGAAYLADYSGRITRLNIAEGGPQEGWVVELDSHVVATPAFEAGTLYVPTADGRIVLIQGSDGAILNTLKTSDQRIWGQPALREGSIFVGDLDNGVTTALDTATGDVEWAQEISGPTAADLVLDGDLLIAGAFDQFIHALDVSDGGAERWAFPGDGWFLARPLVHEGVVYAPNMSGSVFAIDRETGEEVWSFRADDAQFRAGAVMQGENLIVVARDGRVFALNPADGSVTWVQDATVEGNVNANPLVSGDDIYLVTSQHDLVRVDAARQGAFQNVPLTAADR